MENEEITLDAFLLEDGKPEAFDPLTFIINDDDEALWAMRSLAQAQRKINVVERQAQDEVARINTWKELVTKSPTNTVVYFTNALKSYLLRIREDGRKSLVLPDGELTSRSIADKAAVSDAEVFIKWAKDNHRQAWVRFKEEVNLSALKDGVFFSGGAVVDNETGETIDGLVHVESGVSVTLKISE